ncbi:MAG: hypothetical protein JNL10_06425 [Verrucomicrobiales bacterium]|nr:hypothetical protein [Verrucomicrobiales bacterium]
MSPRPSFLCCTALLMPILATVLHGADPNPQWQGRTFVRVLQQGDPIPGATDGSVFLNLDHFTLRDQTLHLIAGTSTQRKGLYRWRDGQLTALVDNRTQSPTGSPFDTIHFTTDETAGALNFVGEVFFGRPGFVYGLFEWRDGVITKLLDTATPVDGKTFLGFGYPVRVGTQVVFGSQYFENGAMRYGIFRWDGTTLHTVIRTGDDLPGALGAFAGQPDRYQIAFDGTDVAFVATDSPQGQPPSGFYRTIGGNLVKLVDGTERHESGATYAELGIPFINIDLEGDYTFLGLGQPVAAAGNRRYYGPGFRYTPNGTDVSTETVLPMAPLDGQLWTDISQVDGQGDDVAYRVKLADGYLAVYAAVGSGTPPAAPVLQMLTLPDGGLRLRFASAAGTKYTVESRASLTGADWSFVTELQGNGADLEYQPNPAEGGYFRVRL